MVLCILFLIFNRQCLSRNYVSQGDLIICGAKCPWGNCPWGQMSWIQCFKCRLPPPIVTTVQRKLRFISGSNRIPEAVTLTKLCRLYTQNKIILLVCQETLCKMSLKIVIERGSTILAYRHCMDLTRYERRHRFMTDINKIMALGIYRNICETYLLK